MQILKELIATPVSKPSALEAEARAPCHAPGRRLHPGEGALVVVPALLALAQGHLPDDAPAVGGALRRPRPVVPLRRYREPGDTCVGREGKGC